jgi:beta-lactamase class A
MLTRRTALASIAAAIASPRALFASPISGFESSLQAIEKKSGGRLGVAVLFPQQKTPYHLHGDQRFPMCSTFKFLAASLVLKRIDQGKEHLDRAISYTKADLVTYSPETEKHAGGSMKVSELCKAALTLSDNTAANLLLASFGGPPAITAFARSIGDSMTRLDRTETTLNEATPGDPRDTTTPDTMLHNLQRVLLGNVLQPESRQQLTDWMLANTTSGAKFRAVMPAGWKLADKTGSGEHGSNNDIGVFWTPEGKPIVVTSYLTETTISTDACNAIHADVGRAIVEEYAKQTA